MIYFNFPVAFIGTVQSVRKSQLQVVVEKMLYEGLPTKTNKLKIYLSDPDDALSRSQTCCKRITTNSTSIFAGYYKISRKVKHIVNGCRTIYRLPVEKNAELDVDNIEHTFLEQCRFRLLSSSD